MNTNCCLGTFNCKITREDKTVTGDIFIGGCASTFQATGAPLHI